MDIEFLIIFIASMVLILLLLFLTGLIRYRDMKASEQDQNMNDALKNNFVSRSLK